MAEFAVAFLLAVLSLPVVVLAAAVIGVLSRCSPLVAHRRIGQFGSPYWMLKLRTMWGPGPESVGPLWIERIEHREVPLHKGVPDPRVTSRFARLCRRYSVDELPQLWHVLSGRMSLAGPRPLTAIELEQHYGEAANEVLKLRPGITGLWQVLGRNRLTYHQRRRLDLFLARHRTPSLCLFILRRTLPVVLGGKDAA